MESNRDMRRSTPTPTGTHTIWILALAIAACQAPAAQPAYRLALDLADFAALPITGELDRAEHARAAGQGQLPP